MFTVWECLCIPRQVLYLMFVHNDRSFPALNASPSLPVSSSATAYSPYHHDTETDSSGAPLLL